MGFLQERFRKVNIVNDQVSGWAKKVRREFGALTQLPDGEKDDLTKVF